MNQQPERKLSADVFDTIDLMSLATEGIGAGKDYDFVLDHWEPCCIHGQAHEAEGTTFGAITRNLFRAGITRTVNDEAVRAINRRQGRPLNGRVDFLTEYAPHLNIVRA